MILKTCPGCGVEKPTSAFGRNAGRPDGVAFYCKTCFQAASRASYRRRADRKGKIVKEPIVVPEGMSHCPKCGAVKALEEFPRNRSKRSGYGTYGKPCHNETTRKNVVKNYGSSRHYHLRRRYGIGAAEVEQMLEAQRWTCLVCEVLLTVKTAHVDHDHITGAVRGILCFNCNGGLGQFKDNPTALRRAALYVELSLPPRKTRVRGSRYGSVAGTLDRESSSHGRESSRRPTSAAVMTARPPQ